MEKALASTREAQLASAVASAKLATEGDLARKRVAELEGTELKLRAELELMRVALTRAQFEADAVERRAQERSAWIEPRRLAVALEVVQRARPAKNRITLADVTGAMTALDGVDA